MTCNTLKFNLTPLNVNLSFGMDKPSQLLGVTDVQVEGNSIVDASTANLNLGQGLSFQNQELILTLDDTQEINPKNMTLTQQDAVKIYIEENGVLKQVSLNDLDYNKIKVQEVEDLSEVNIGDFIFLEGVYIKQKTGTNTSEVMHPETDAEVVLYTNTIEGVNVDNVKEALDKLATGIGVSGVKGDNEATYRIGNVNLTPANIGAIPNTEKASANGVATLDNNVKVPISQLPDFIVGQMVYGGTVDNIGIATLTANGKTKLGVTSSTINLPTSPTSVYEGVYFIADNTCDNSTIVGVANVTVGDWLIVTNLTWKKIDNTDSVSSVNNKTGAVVLTASDIQYDSTHTITQQFDVVDKVPTPTSTDAGKILIVNNNGEYTLSAPTVITEAEYAYINSSEYGQ